MHWRRNIEWATETLYRSYGITVRVMTTDILFLVGLGLKVILLNYFPRKTSLLTHVDKMRDMKGEMFCRNYCFLYIDVCDSCYGQYGISSLLCHYFRPLVK
jgi:hypothetical protein